MECKQPQSVDTVVNVKVFFLNYLEYQTIIGILYDYKNKTLSYTKNGINYGVAFKNVPSGLTPSLDLWFESGSVEILKTNTEKIFL